MPGIFATWDENCLALIEVSDGPEFLVVQVLASDGYFETLFETELIKSEVLDRLHLPVVLRVSMSGHPVAKPPCGPDGNLPKGNSLQTGIPLQDSLRCMTFIANWCCPYWL
jgi:hypothetical protein